MSDKRQRTRQVAVRFTPDELAQVTAYADRYHRTVPGLIRDMILGASLRVPALLAGENEGGAARVGALTAPDRTPPELAGGAG